MNCTLSSVIAFTVGAAVGSLVTWQLLKTKYEKLAQEEIEAFKDEYPDRANETVEVYEGDTVEEKTPTTVAEFMATKEKPDIREYAAMLQNQAYTNYSSIETKKEVTDVDRPYVIDPDTFDDNDYNTVSLTYFADGTLAYEDDTPIDRDTADEMIGLESLNHFGEYEDDSVFVRNDATQTDYEILLDTRKYSDVVYNGPHLDDDE